MMSARMGIQKNGNWSVEQEVATFDDAANLTGIRFVNLHTVLSSLFCHWASGSQAFWHEDYFREDFIVLALEMNDSRILKCSNKIINQSHHSHCAR